MTTFTTLLFAVGLPARSESIPKADYQLKLDNYDIQFLDYQFPSGLRILFQEEHSQPIVTIVNVIDKGSEMDQVDTDGIAHVIEHLAFRARHGDLPKNWDLLHQLGASINAYTNTDETLYATVAPVDSLVPILRIEAKRISDGVANVTEEDVEAEKSIVRNELRQSYENAAVGEGWDELNRQLFTPDWSYYRSTIGTHDTISNINLAKVQELVKNHYVAANSTIVVVGDFELEQAPEFIAQAFGDMPELLADPDDPEGQIKPGEIKPRVDCANRPEPPAPHPDAVVPRVKGMVDNETVLLAWSAPGGYCGDEPVMAFAASQLTQYIYFTLVPSWEWDDPEQSIDGIGCFADTAQTASTVVCYIEPSASGGYSGEKLVRKASDALYLQWERENPEYKPLIDKAYQEAKMGYMADVLSTVDLVSSLFSGRAFDAAKTTHYTADPRYFSRMFEAINKVDAHQVQEFARKYLTRDRMVAVIIEPMDEEERARREAAAGGADINKTYTAETRDRSYEYAFDFETMTPDKIEAVTVVPDRSKMRELTFDNGLKVVLLPHGEAPMAHAGIIVHGSNLSSPQWGLDSFAESMHRRGYGKDERELAVAALYGETQGNRGRYLTISGSSGNLDAMLHTLRFNTGHIDWRISKKSQWLKSQDSSYKSDGEHPDVWADRLQKERLYGDNPLGYWWTPERRTAQKAWALADVQKWVLSKYQPANATLVITGKIDLDAAEAAARKFFDAWQPEPQATVGMVPYEPKATNVPQRQVLIFDKPTATQTEIIMGCPLEWTVGNAAQDATAQVMSDVLSEQAWRTLREEKGTTYGAYAYTAAYSGGTGSLNLYSLVQNDATGFAVETYFKLVEDAKAGKSDPTQVTSQKWSRARKYVLGQQAGADMLTRILGQDDMGYFDTYKAALANVDGGDFPAMLGACVGHEVVTVVGPKEYAEKLLTDRGIKYEVVDWEKLLESTMTPKELKKRAKAKAKEEEEKAKKEAEGA